jgi:hypothetical protein
VVKGRSVMPKPALGPGEKVSGLQDPEEATVHHALHCLTQATNEADRSVSSCVRAICNRLQNKDEDGFFPAIRHQALRQYAVVYGLRKFLACEWKV